MLSELGLVGFALLLTGVLAILGGVARLARGPDRALYATILAVLSAWAAATSFDWHWEMPVVTVGFFALGGAALAQTKDRVPGGRPLGMFARGAAVTSLGMLLVLLPLRVAVSHDQLRSAILSPPSLSCDQVETFADRSIAAIVSRPQPYEVKAACELTAGRAATATELMNEAISREPANWRPRYGLAVIRARTGKDPRSAARAALTRNPREPLAREAFAAFNRRVGSRRWRESSRSMRVLTPPL